MASNLPPTQKENWAPNEVVKPEHTNSWGRAINTLAKAVPLYSACGNVYTATYTNNVYNLTPLSFTENTSNVTVDSYVDGMSVIFQCPTNNLASCSVNVNSLGAKTIKTIDNVNLPAGKLNSGVFVELKYDKTNDCFKFQQDFNKADRNFSNLTEEAEKHFLNKSQITNCLLEVPQRIKYTLENGTLTIKAGGVVIVPYGTEDKTADLPKGATFINENFKVYHTQYTEDADGNGKFFVWAELRKDLDIITNETISLTGLLIGLDDNNGDGFWSAANFSSGSSFPSSPQNTDVFYHVTNNRVYFYNQSQWVTTDLAGNDFLIFPPIKFTGVNKQIVSVDQVFNGMGYIGSTVWVDKGVKGLAPNGRNADGSLVNEEVVTDKLYVRNFAFTNLTSIPFVLWHELADGNAITSTKPIIDNKNIVYEQSVMPTSTIFRWIDTANNQIIFKNPEDPIETLHKPYKIKNILLAEGMITNNKITSFAPKLPFRATDENDIDGMLKMVNNRLLDGYNLAINATRQVDLSSVLPNDGEIYECRFVYQTSTGYNQTAFIYQQTDIELQSSAMWRGRSFSTGASMQGGGTFITYVGGQRYINLISTSASSGACNIVLDLRSYRKVGK